ncbi:hypothetical protein [Clostridioides difficile]|nr:hypothetical protein [Clostridioides difficile]MDV9368819.1 hypothetical protein [Clostridioides difficile]
MIEKELEEKMKKEMIHIIKIIRNERVLEFTYQYLKKIEKKIAH